MATNTATPSPIKKKTDLCQAFAGCSRQDLGKEIRDGVELEDKTTLAFFVSGKEVSDKVWMDDYNARHPDAPITYPGQLIENELIAEGIISYGHGQDQAYTKNLVSYCFDKEDGSLSEENITLRVRHEEHRHPETGKWIPKAPDTSTKFPVQQGDTSVRFEYESSGDLNNHDGQHKFVLSLINIIEDQVGKRLEKEGGKSAMDWLRAFTDKVGFDFTDKREKTNINCRRTQPYAVMYTRKNAQGALIRDTETGKPALFKPAERLNEMEKQAGMTESRLVFMFCLDVNRFWAPHITGSKIMKDHELEHEHQDHACSFTPGSIRSSGDVTPEEVSAMDDYLKDMKARVMDENGLGHSPLSGMNKDARGEHYLRGEIPDHSLPQELSVRGRQDNFEAHVIKGMEDLYNQSAIVRKARMLEITENKLQTVRQNVLKQKHALFGLRAA